MQTRRAVLEYTLHLGDEEVALGEKRADLQLVGGGAPAEDAAGQIDGAEGEVCEERGREVDFPPLGLHFDDAPDDQVADFGRVACAEGRDGEEFVGAEDGAGDGGVDGGGGGGWGGGGVCAVASGEGSDGERFICEKVQLVINLIHCGSSVRLSPGVTRCLLESRGRLRGLEVVAMSTSPSESIDPSPDDSKA